MALSMHTLSFFDHQTKAIQNKYIFDSFSRQRLQGQTYDINGGAPTFGSYHTRRMIWQQRNKNESICSAWHKLYIYTLYVYVVSSDIMRLTHWGRVTHICVSKLTIIGSDNGLSPDRRQAIVWTNAGILLIGPLGTNFSEILIEILAFSFKNMRMKVSSAKRRPFCLGLNLLTIQNE